MSGQARRGGQSGGKGGRTIVWGGAAALMLAPAIASRTTDEMAWDRADFIVFGLMLAAAGGAWEIAMRGTRSPAYAAGATVAAGAALLLFLVNAAVGFIGDEDNLVNLVFFAVPTLALGGAVIVRFRPDGMARTMAVTAAAQVAAGGLGVMLVPDLRGFLVGTALFVPLWLLSSRLFARAAREEAA
ncbi:MAG: hypothetical protein QOJ91_385 [Sphingomonadales bacterium]|jgi:hypothetical protein|nr:hypothetical protein [Sphingomonadales bacterium]